MNDPAGHLLSFPITQLFGNPDQSFSGHHTGIDFATPIGTPLYALRDGRVVYTSNGTLPPNNIDFAQGISVMVECIDGERWWFAHLSKLDVSLDNQVICGQQVGLSGVSGAATGPHLHLERQYPSRVPIDPLEELIVLSTEGQAQIEAIMERVAAKYAAQVAGAITAGFNDTLPRELRSMMRGVDPFSPTAVPSNATMITANEPIFPTTAK